LTEIPRYTYLFVLQPVADSSWKLFHGAAGLAAGDFG